MADHPLRARVEARGEAQELDATLDVLEALTRAPRDVYTIADCACFNSEHADDLRSVSKRLSHLVKRHAAREMIARVGDRPKGIPGTFWDVTTEEGEPLVLVATRLQRSIPYVRGRLNAHVQNCRNNGDRPVSVARMWVITDEGMRILRRSM